VKEQSITNYKTVKFASIFNEPLKYILYTHKHTHHNLEEKRKVSYASLLLVGILKSYEDRRGRIKRRYYLLLDLLIAFLLIFSDCNSWMFFFLAFYFYEFPSLLGLFYFKF